VISGLFGSGVGAVVVGVWGYPGAFVMAGSIGLFAGCLALFLRQPGRNDRGKVLVTANPQPVSREVVDDPA
jgi:hypothetical protein